MALAVRVKNMVGTLRPPADDVQGALHSPSDLGRAGLLCPRAGHGR